MGICRTPLASPGCLQTGRGTRGQFRPLLSPIPSQCRLAKKRRILVRLILAWVSLSPFVSPLTSFTSPIGLTGKWRDELAGGEVVEGAEATGQLVKAQAPLAVEPAQKLLGRALPLLRVAIQTARD